MKDRAVTAVTVPMKSLRQAKQRLQGVLAADARMALARAMLCHVLATVQDSGIASLAVLVSPDPDVLALAPAHGFAPLPELHPGYNAAVGQALRWAAQRGATQALVLPADLPWLRSADLQAIVKQVGGDSPAALIAPDAARSGTNALYLRPLTLFAPAFGANSFARHRALARAAGVAPTIYTSPTLAHDIDLPADLHHLPLAQPSELLERTD